MTNRLLAAADAALCDTLRQLGPSLVGLAVWTMWTPKVGLSALGAGAAANLAYNYACTEFEAGEAPSNSNQRGCTELTAGTMGLYKVGGGGYEHVFRPLTGYYIEFYRETPGVDNSTDFWLWVQTRINGSYSKQIIPVSLANDEYLITDLHDGAVCGQQAPYEPPNPPAIEPFTYTDESTNCELEVNFLGFIETYEGAPPQAVYGMKSPTEQRAGGGRMGGCYFPETIVIHGGGRDGGGGGGPTTPIPYPPFPPEPGPDGEPWWVPYAKAALGGAVSGIVEEAIEGLLPDETYPGAVYRHVSVCEKDADGEPISEAVEVPIPELPAPAAQLARLDALVALLQANKDFKQPICVNDKPVQEGEFRTISFRSDETSPYGKSRLRKRFRYRSLSGLGLSEVVDHWADFSFQAGPVCVQHSGASWGTPQVWANTADEGKRVIRHAAGEAGVDPDQVGRWTISSSSSARVGVSSTMKVDTTGGYYWITARDGSNNRPIVAKT